MNKLCPKCMTRFAENQTTCPTDGTLLVNAPDELKPGDIIENRYTILEKLGEGGMGVVYKAEQHVVKRHVALKVLRLELGIKEDLVLRFLTEAQAIASLNSQNTITLYDFGITSSGMVYYTMELLHGETLASLLRREGPLEPARALRLLLQVCDSLEEAHERGILHRDIKPENLFVIQREGREFVKVMDFGIAKIGESSQSGSMTLAGSVVGTPEYLSPEQAMGNKVGPSTDIYSLGIVLFEMLTGAPPFKRESHFKTMLAHVQETLPSVESMNPKLKLHPTLTALVQRALAKIPEERFQSAAEFRDVICQSYQMVSPVTASGLPVADQGPSLELARSQTTSSSADRTKIRITNQAFICPQPVVVIGAHVDGRPNYTTISWVTRVSFAPALMAIAVGKKHHTNKGIRQTGEFTVNIPTVDMIKKVDFCGMFSGETTPKDSVFRPFYGVLKNAPMIEDCSLSMECRVVDRMSFYGHDLFVGEIVGVYTEERFLTDDKPDMGKMKPIALSTPDTKYWSVGTELGTAWRLGRELKNSSQ